MNKVQVKNAGGRETRQTEVRKKREEGDRKEREEERGVARVVWEREEEGEESTKS